MLLVGGFNAVNDAESDPARHADPPKQRKTGIIFPQPSIFSEPLASNLNVIPHKNLNSSLVAHLQTNMRFAEHQYMNCLERFFNR